MGGAAENCRPEPRGTIYIPADSCIIIKGRARASAFAETRAAFASPRRPSRIYLNAIPHSRTCTTDLGKRQPQPLLDHGRLGRDGPQNSGVLGGIEAADCLHISDEDVAVVRLGDAVAERFERLDPKRVREDTRRDSAARWTKLTAKLDPIGMALRQTRVKEWE